MGAEAIKTLLEEINLSQEIENINKELELAVSQKG